MIHIGGIIIAALVYLYEREYQKNKRFAERMQEVNERKDKLNADLMKVAEDQQKLIKEMQAERKGVYKIYDN